MSAEGHAQGRFEATGIRPRFLDHVAAYGMSLSAELFRPEMKLNHE